MHENNLIVNDCERGVKHEGELGAKRAEEIEAGEEE